jgi:CRISPR-associated protein Csc1
MRHYIYRCDLALHDYLFFASTERGKVAETSPFVHNYALTYAMGWVQSAWHNEQQRARYHADLSPIQHRYITPAQLLRGTSIVMQYNTLSEQLRFEKQRSIGYPDWGFIKCFKPGTLFRAYVVSQEQESFPRYIRLGKFMAKTKLDVIDVKSVKQKQGICQTTALLNWNDLQEKPSVFNIQAASLPTRLITYAFFDEIAFLEASFPGDGVIKLPLGMRYLLDVE